MKFTRRSALKSLGVAGLAGAGVGVGAFSQSAAAMSSNLDAANPGVVRNDRGDVSEVFVAPTVATRWSGFDEVPLKLRYVLEAGIEGRGYKPVYRETPWLFTDGDDPSGTATHGTTDRVPDSGRSHLLTNNSDFYTINGNGDTVDPDDGSQIVAPKIVLYKEDVPTNAVSGNAYHDEQSDYPDPEHWTGASLNSGSGDDVSDSGAYANGNYGVIGDTSLFDADTDGEQRSRTVHLRLTTALLNADSETVMQDEYPAYSGEAGYTYTRLRDIAPDNPAVSVTETTFTVTADNIAAESGTNGSANAGAN